MRKPQTLHQLTRFQGFAWLQRLKQPCYLIGYLIAYLIDLGILKQRLP